MEDLKVDVVPPFWSTTPLSAAALERLKKLTAFYSPERIQTYLIPLINQQSRVSLRALDWLVTNHSKRHNVVYMWQISPMKKKEIVTIHENYKNWLRHFRCRLYDPFRRGQRIYFIGPLQDNTEKLKTPCVQVSNNTAQYPTTVAQLNFLYFAWIYGVYDYAEKHIHEIVPEMKKIVKSHPIDRTKPTKRRQLSAPQQRKCFIYKVEGSRCFDSDSESEKERKRTSMVSYIASVPVVSKNTSTSTTTTTKQPSSSTKKLVKQVKPTMYKKREIKIKTRRKRMAKPQPYTTCRLEEMTEAMSCGGPSSLFQILTDTASQSTNSITIPSV